MTELAQDFIDLLLELTDHEVDFIVVGGYAVAFHGHPRATKDLDVFVRASSANAEKLYRALAAFGAPLQRFEVNEKDFVDYGGVLQLGLPPFRIDIINRISGVTYDEASKGVGSFDLAGRSIRVIGREALIKNKLEAARDQDLVDAKVLAKAKK